MQMSNICTKLYFCFLGWLLFQKVHSGICEWLSQTCAEVVETRKKQYTHLLQLCACMFLCVLLYTFLYTWVFACECQGALKHVLVHECECVLPTAMRVPDRAVVCLSAGYDWDTQPHTHVFHL